MGRVTGLTLTSDLPPICHSDLLSLPQPEFQVGNTEQGPNMGFGGRVLALETPGQLLPSPSFSKPEHHLLPPRASVSSLDRPRDKQWPGAGCLDPTWASVSSFAGLGRLPAQRAWWFGHLPLFSHTRATIDRPDHLDLSWLVVVATCWPDSRERVSLAPPHRTRAGLSLGQGQGPPSWASLSPGGAS